MKKPIVTENRAARENHPEPHLAPTRPFAPDLTRSKLVFRAYLDARACDDDDEAAELFQLWLTLLGRAKQ